MKKVLLRGTTNSSNWRGRLICLFDYGSVHFFHYSFDHEQVNLDREIISDVVIYGITPLETNFSQLLFDLAHSIEALNSTVILMVFDSDVTLDNDYCVWDSENEKNLTVIKKYAESKGCVVVSHIDQLKKLLV